MLRWLTCTPRDFIGNDTFFARDSGLICRGFQAIGVASKAIMTGVPRPDDDPDLIRATFDDLTSPEWWASHNAEGVVFYAWGRAEYTPIAAAIRKAGLKLVLNQDSSGAVGPLAGWHDWVKDLSARCGGRFGGLLFIARFLHAHAAGLILNDLRRAQHFQHGTIIAAVSPVAESRYRRLCRRYGGKRLEDRVRLIPHPAQPRFRWIDGAIKHPLVISVGRWNDRIQKRPQILAETVELVAQNLPDVQFEIYGPTGPFLPDWHKSLPPSLANRIKLLGSVPSLVLENAYRRAKVFLCSSAYEGAQISAQEALCSGASVVAARRPSLACYEWFSSNACGTLANGTDSLNLAHATVLELAAWNSGKRNPEEISSRWSAILHAEAVTRTILLETSPL